MRTRLLLASCSLVLALVVYFGPNRHFPNSADDWSYLFQARLFASGHVWAEDALYDRAHPLQRYLGTNCVTDYAGRRFSKYPPGWPLLLSVGSAAGVEWLVAPLLGALLVFLVLGDVERRVGPEWVTRAWLLLALCAFFSYTFQSFRSHTATMVCLFAAFLIYEKASGGGGASSAPTTSAPRGGSSAPTDRVVRWCVMVSGALVGCAALVRYVDWIPLALWIGWDLARHRRIRHLALFTAAFALVASGNLLYDALLSGSPFMTPTVLNDPLGPHDRLVASWRGFPVTGIRLGAVLYAFPPVMALLAWRYWRESRLKRYGALFLMSAAVYFFYVVAIGGPGPRYLSAYLPFLLVVTVDAWRWLTVRHPASSRVAWRTVIVLQVAASAIFAGIEFRRVYERQDLARAIDRLESGRKIVVLKTGPRGETWADFTRNPASLSSADVLYLGWGDGVGLDRLIARFPGRRVFVYEYPGRLTPRGAARSAPVVVARPRFAP